MGLSVDRAGGGVADKSWALVALAALLDPCAKVVDVKRPATLGLTLAAAALMTGGGCTQHSSTDSPAASTRTSAPAAQVTTTTKPPPTTTAPSTTTTAPVPSPPPAAAPPSAAGIQIGPGPQATYTVQPQPTPGSCHYTFVGTDPLPDPRCTPGAINPEVTQADIDSTICSSGYTSTVRPPESVTEPEKDASAAAYGYTGSLHIAEYDHLVPLELGGDPNDPANLWVEPPDNPNATSFSNTKDLLEYKLNSLVCSGQLTLAVAQQAIAGNWVTAYQTYGGE
jgi:hypothetical protein